ncbi:MAG: hypothetical protein QOF70_3729 [Acetobacteraceae bacterium]|jgi:hypothetical protein|nr:hypothetical protein [Acetobacteraceae bacterium]
MSPTAKRLVADIRESAAQIARNPKWPASQGPKHLGSSMTLVLTAAISVTSVGYPMRSYNARGKPPAKVEKGLA